MKIHISHGADSRDWFVVRPLDGDTGTTIGGRSLTHDMAIVSLLNAGRTVYELEVTAKLGTVIAVRPGTGGGDDPSQRV